MKIVLSRKGFDSAAGGVPSPILPDGRMVSLPIPDKKSEIRYEDIEWRGSKLGGLVETLTGSRIPRSHFAHLDPDLVRGSYPREPNWRPLLGQTGASQSHLRNCGVGPGDLFLFFGLFRDVDVGPNGVVWRRGAKKKHVIWGWLQVDQVVGVDELEADTYPWARYHPHFHRGKERNNTLYLSTEFLELPGTSGNLNQGAGVFSRYTDALCLTDPAANSVGKWLLPDWFYPGGDRPPMTYHTNIERWERTSGGCTLNLVSRGQEFVLDTAAYPEALDWVYDLIGANSQ